MFNKKHSKESKEKIRLSMTGKKKSKETMVKISETLSSKSQRKQNRYRSFLGHILSIYTSISKYASRWELPVSSVTEFKQWSVSDSVYEELFNIWRDSDYNKFEVPVVMRRNKKQGFIVDNLDWKRKGSYSWWGEEYEIQQVIREDLDKQQSIKNPGTQEWQEKVKKQWKENKRKKLK